MSTTTEPELAHVHWHRLGAVGTLSTLIIISVAALVQSGLDLAGIVVLTLAVCAVPAVHAVVRRHRSARWWILWPVWGIAALGLFGAADPKAATLVPGLFFVQFLYTGLTQPRGRSLLLLPLALVALWEVLDLSTGATVIRLAVAALALTTAAELPALILRRVAQQQKVLETSAETDALTGLRNRHGLEQLLQQMEGESFLVLLDLDHFKRYNDRFGHLAGDRVLADFAAMLLRQTRTGDVVIRYGGEEFLIVLSGVDIALATRIVARWATVWNANKYGITFSGGITNSTGEESLGRADKLLYAAKAAGRNRVEVGLVPDS